jgi:single-stranded DNA-binding protein
MIDSLIGGTLKGAPSERTASNGSTYVVARVIAADSKARTHLVNVMAYSESVRAMMLELADGDSICVSGAMQVGTFAAADGEIKPSISMVASTISTPYAVRNKRKRLAGDDEAERTGNVSDPQTRRAAGGSHGKGGQGNWRSNGAQRASRSGDQLQQLGGTEIARRLYGDGARSTMAVGFDTMPDDDV